MNKEMRLDTFFEEKVKKAIRHPNSCEAGIWYALGKATDARNPDEAKDVSEGIRKHITWVNLKD